MATWDGQRPALLGDLFVGSTCCCHTSCSEVNTLLVMEQSISKPLFMGTWVIQIPSSIHGVSSTDLLYAAHWALIGDSFARLKAVWWGWDSASDSKRHSILLQLLRGDLWAIINSWVCVYVCVCWILKLFKDCWLS